MGQLHLASSRNRNASLVELCNLPSILGLVCSFSCNCSCTPKGADVFQKNTGPTYIGVTFRASYLPLVQYIIARPRIGRDFWTVGMSCIKPDP